MGSSCAFFGLDNQEGVSILALVLGFASVCWPVLAANLGTGNVDNSKLVTTPLVENRSGTLLIVDEPGNVHFHSTPAAGP